MKNEKKKKKLVQKLDGLLEHIILIVLILCFLVGLYGVADTLSVYYSAQDKSSLKYKPEEGQTLHTEITDNVAWLTIDDSTIDYAIMQGEKNEDYLNADVYGNYSLSGSIFLDYRNNSEFSDDYSLVYGHHMEKGLMFGCLDNWLDEEYFNSHTTGTITTKNRIYRLELYAVVEALASTSEIFQPTETSFGSTVKYVKENAMRMTDVEPTHLVALSTCKYPDTDDRTITFWQMTTIYEGEDTEMDQTKQKEISDSDTQVGMKLFKNIEPVKANKTILDSILSFVGIK